MSDVAGRAPTARVDFQNADSAGRVRLNTAGALKDVETQRIELEDGMVLRLVDAELEARGRVEFNSSEGVWVAAIDWTKLVS